MKLYKCVLFVLLVVFCSLAAKAQEQIELRKIDGGALNGKAISLPKPTYPETAKAAKASGAVTVEVIIDEGGKVISAKAVSGHPLLRAAAVEAALQAKFSPTTLSGQPVKVTGSLVYNFVSDEEERAAVKFVGGPSEGRSNTDNKTIMGGVLNGKAISLPKPEYPAIARAAHVSGTVVVQVVVDEEGKVFSATAISGHPLLKSAALQAAYGAKFTPTLLQGQPVKITGTINYSFSQPMSWIQIGDELERAERTASAPSSSVAANLPAQEFELEIQQLNALPNNQINSSLPVKVESSETDAKPEVGKSPSGKRALIIIGNKEEPISREEYSKRINAVINSLQSKLVSDSVRAWYFSLGLIIGRARESMDDESSLRDTLESLRQHSINAPLGIADSVSSKLQQLITYANKNEINNADKEKIRSLLFSILSTPIEKE